MSDTTSNADLNWIANYIWGIADDVLRDLYVRGKYRDVILPMTVLRRLDAVLEPTKQAVLDAKAMLDEARIVEQEAALRAAAGQAFYNTSKFTLRDLRARTSRQQLRADFEAYLDGFSPGVQDILDNFEFRNQIPRLSKADALGTLIEKLTSPDVNLGPDPVRNTDGSIRHPGLDNHGMGSIFEELVRRFNEENNEEAGEHWTPRDAVRLMARLVFLPVAEQIKSGTYLLYDGACGTGGMLTVAEETLRQLAAEHGKDVSTHLYGQEINAETYAICKADLLLKGEGEAADNIVGGPAQSTLANDAFPSREFDFMLSNPPYGKSWKTDLERMGGKRDMRDPRFVIEHAGDPEYSLVTLLQAATTELSVGYFGHLFKSTRYIGALQSTANFIRDGQDLNFENFCRVDVPFPPVEEQHQIAEAVDSATARIASSIERLRRQISSLRDYRARLIVDAVTGKVDVREAAAGLPEPDPLTAEQDPADDFNQHHGSGAS